jgi:hypothetical protein
VAGATTTRFKQQTLPGVFFERLVGANVSYFFSPRAHLGATAYAADVAWLPGGELDFAPAARYPAGGRFGAGGIDAAWGTGWFDVFVEASHVAPAASLGAGGVGVVLRTTAACPGTEVEWSNRYYGRDFENPYAGSVAAADELDGLRARDELGTRVRYHGTLADRRLSLRGQVDLWLQPSEQVPKGVAGLGADYQLTEQLRPGFSLELRSKDLKRFSRSDCYDLPASDEETDQAAVCRGEKIQVMSRLTVTPSRGWTLSSEYAVGWYDAALDDHTFARDRLASVRTTVVPTATLRVKARVRWRETHLEDGARGENSVGVSGQISSRLAAHTNLSLRYDVVAYVDARPSTRLRAPNPEQWGRVDLTQSF